ncbi:hypothetical protein QQ045_020532 [Rhodiola kirilowii]
MASRKRCEMFIRNLLDGASQMCFNCGFHQQMHENHVVINIVSDSDLDDDEPQQVVENPQQPPELVLLTSDSDSDDDPEWQLMRNSGRPTIFNREQIRRMIAYASQLGWKLYPHRRNPDVQMFCDSVGVTRTQFRGWLHSNKNKYQDRRN